MKIITVIDGFPPENSGGSEHVALNLSRGLQAAGHEVTVITATQKQEQAGESIHEGLRVFRIYSSSRSRFAQSYIGIWNPFIKKLFVDILKKENPDIVHFHNIHTHISYAALKWTKQNTKAKIFFTAHDVLSFAYTRLTHFINPHQPVAQGRYDYRMTPARLFRQAGKMYNPFRNLIIRRYLKLADKIFVVSNALGEAFKQNGILNTQTIYNGIDISRLDCDGGTMELFKSSHSLNNKKVILFAGRPMSAKGLVPLIESLPIVIQKNPTAVLAMAIQGSYAEQIKKLISEKSLTNHVVFLGHHTGTDWAAMFHSSDVVVVPSIYFDPAPLVSMEAMAAGKPVVGTCFGGTPEIIEQDQTGFIVNPYDRNGMADRISTLLSDGVLAQTFGANGRKRVESRFTITHQVQATLAAYAKK